MIRPIIGVAPDPNILFMVLFKTGSHVIGRRWVSFLVFRLLGLLSIYYPSSPVFDVDYDLATMATHCMRRCSHILLLLLN